MERLVSLLIGYAFGLIQTGYFYGKLHHIDIRKQGSGNAGTTNALRILGWKAGAVTFLGDSFKCVFAVALVHLLYAKGCAELMPLLSMYAGMGAVLGHNYPFYMKFRGGKGIAVTGGLIFSTMNIWVTLLCLLVFLLLVAATKYVSVGSLAVVTLYFLCVILYGRAGGFHVSRSNLYEIYAVVALLTASAFFKHRENIRRLLAGTENKLSVGKRRR